MKAAVYEQFEQPLTIRSVPDPTSARDGVVVAVHATGVCRSDWHGWMGHDPDIALPHVPGHELAGAVVTVGSDVANWRVGDRVTVPFAGGCGRCPQCLRGDQHICDDYFQPGFTAWGSFAEYVAIAYADTNLVRLPETVDYVAAASLGCRFITAYRAVVAQGRVGPGEWLTVYGCGGVGLSAIMIGAAMGAQVIGVDVQTDALVRAQAAGATAVVDASEVDPVEAVHELTNGGAHISLDALGHRQTCRQSILSLRKRGRHVQVGLLLADEDNPPLPMSRVIGWELEIVGSHGMQAHAYPPMLDLIERGVLRPLDLVGRTIGLDEAGQALADMGRFASPGVTVIDRF